MTLPKQTNETIIKRYSGIFLFFSIKKHAIKNNRFTSVVIVPTSILVSSDAPQSIPNMNF